MSDQDKIKIKKFYEKQGYFVEEITEIKADELTKQVAKTDVIYQVRIINENKVPETRRCILGKENNAI